MNKVIIKSRKGELTQDLLGAGYLALGWFKTDLDSGKYGEGWDSCHYGYQGFSSVAKLNKSGSITIEVE